MNPWPAAGITDAEVIATTAAARKNVIAVALMRHILLVKQFWQASFHAQATTV
jgi:hypothetical protein